MSAWEGGGNDEIAQLKAQLNSLTMENNVLKAQGGADQSGFAGAPAGGRTGRSTSKKDGNTGGRGGEGGGRTRAPKEGQEPLEDYDGRIVWVSAESTTQTVSKSVTGAALPSARKGFPVHVFSKYAKNSNMAIKGIISAQRILQQKYSMNIGVTPSFRGNRQELTLKVNKWEGGELPHVADPSIAENAIELSVAGETDPKSLAGAIAAHARCGNTLSIRAIGANAVFEMLRSVGVARSYLSDDAQGQDLVCFPDFIEVQLNGRSDLTNALRLIVVLTPESPRTVKIEAPPGVVGGLAEM